MTDAEERIAKIEKILEDNDWLLDSELDHTTYRLFMPFTQLQDDWMDKWCWASAYLDERFCGCGTGYGDADEILAAIMDSYVLREESDDWVFYEYGEEGNSASESLATLVKGILDWDGVIAHGGSLGGAWWESPDKTKKLFIELWNLLEQDDFSKIRRESK